MKELTIHTIESAPAEAREAMRAVEKKFGFVPNLIGELAAAPTAVRAYVALDGLLEQSSLEPAEVQVVLTAVSVANSCEYCVAAHSAGLKQTGLAGDEIEAVRRGSPLADPRMEALRRFVTAVVERRGYPGEEVVDGFLNAGYRKDQILEVLVGVAMKTLSNYTNHIAGTPLDEELGAFEWEPDATGAAFSPAR